MKKNKLICLAVALATTLMVVTGCASSNPATEATGDQTDAEVYKSYILGEFIEADEGTVLFTQEEMKLRVSDKNVTTQKLVINDMFSKQYYSCPISVKTRGLSMQHTDVVVDIVFFVHDDICVPTPYGELHFSDEWADYLDVTVAENKTAYTFCTKTAKKEHRCSQYILTAAENLLQGI